MLDAFRIFARYNRVANERLYEQVGKLDLAEYRRERRGSFGSIHATTEPHSGGRSNLDVEICRGRQNDTTAEYYFVRDLC